MNTTRLGQAIGLIIVLAVLAMIVLASIGTQHR